jgi:hypothetical protein
MRIITFTIVFLLFGCSLQAQVHEKKHTTAHDSTRTTPKVIHRHSFFPHFRAAAFISHTFISGVVEGSRVAIPSYGLDLEYWFDEKLGIGLHNDLELETFIVEQNREEYLEREYPVVSSLDLLYRPLKGLVLQIGPGIEIDRNQSFFLFRLGLEYEVELGHHWDLYPTVFYDAREDSYSTLSVGLGVGKRF